MACFALMTKDSVKHKSTKSRLSTNSTVLSLNGRSMHYNCEKCAISGGISILPPKMLEFIRKNSAYKCLITAASETFAQKDSSSLSWTNDATI